MASSTRFLISISSRIACFSALGTVNSEIALSASRAGFWMLDNIPECSSVRFGATWINSLKLPLRFLVKASNSRSSEEGSSASTCSTTPLKKGSSSIYERIFTLSTP